MGVETRRKPPLPAPTDSSFNQNSVDDNPTEVDLATDLSRRTDRTSYSIPDDGSPVTIDTKKTSDKSRKGLTHIRNKSQTSLLIEYFEAGKGDNVASRPSVRVKVRPSAAKKGREGKDHIQITEDRGARKPSYTRRISLGTTGVVEHEVPPVESSATDSMKSTPRAPIDIEVLNKDGSDLSGTSVSNRNEEYIPINPSEISSMPPDSLLEAHEPATPKRSRSRSITRDETVAIGDTLKAPPRRRSRSLSRERLTKKVIEKLEADKPKKSGKKHSSRSSSVSKEQLEALSSPKRRSASGKHKKAYEDVSSADPSLLSASQVSDAKSFKSGTSKASLTNNPKLLETVEDAIRRLILPELTALKKEQKTQKNREKFENVSHDSVTSGASGSKAELSRSLSKHASDPSLALKGKPKVVLNRDENDPGVTLSGDSIKRKKKSRTSADGVYSDSMADRGYERGMSEETVIRDDPKSPRRKSKDHRTRDALGAAAVGGLVGHVLTQEALKHHDSKSSMASIEKRERRRRRSKSSHSRSRSNSIANTDEIFTKADVPPMPMRSELTNSDVTRDSILTERTSTPASESRRMEIRQVARGSPKQIQSPTSSTPTKSPRANKTLDSYYRNDEREEYDYPASPLSQDVDYTNTSAAAATLGGAAGYWASQGAGESYGSSEHLYGQHRGLSPIQSVASMEEREEESHREAMRSRETLSNTSNIPDHTSRPKGISLESGKDILGPFERRSDPTLHRDPNKDSWYEHENSGNNRDSHDSYDKVDVRHLTNYTDDSMDAPYLDKVTAAQQIRGIENNAEYVHTPMAVESAVASLHGSSIVDGKSVTSGGSGLGRTDSPSAERDYNVSSYDGRPVTRYGPESPLKKQYSAEPELNTLSKSPRQSVAKSLGEYSDGPQMGASALPHEDDPMMPEIGYGLDNRSEISTNPSIIQGIMGESLPDLHHGGYGSASPQKGSHDGVKNAAKHMLEAAAAAGTAAAAAKAIKSKENQSNTRVLGSFKDDYVPADNLYTKPGLRSPAQQRQIDEGYKSETPQPGSGAHTPDHRIKDLYSDEALEHIMGGGTTDLFSGPGQNRAFSRNSHGMASPLYDAATGTGVDRIQSKDIIALMDHLTVRDSQRNARDTEILVTLVRSAAEMRNSFEDMKRFIEDQDNMVIDVGNKQHEKTQRVIGGPRPLPASATRLTRETSVDDIAEDVPSKKRNVFRRALKGLGGRSNNDLVKIEDMLHHLLEEVAELKATQGPNTTPGATRGNGLSSYEALRDSIPDGYEPEGEAVTGSAGNQSGYLSGPPSRQGQPYARRSSGNRVSTVLEHDDEDLEDEPLTPLEQEALQYENTENMLTPTREIPRGGSLPPGTPPTMAVPVTHAPLSNENTPRTENSKKKGHHKSSSSSFFKMPSRWSKTTASSGGDNRASTNVRKERPFSGISHSNSDLQDYQVQEHFDPHGDDRIRSEVSLAREAPRPSSPLVPSSVSENKYQYRATRDSLNLQHPQPRAGQTARYQNHLESQAMATNQAFSSPISPTSDQFGSNPALARFGVGAGNRLSGASGPPLSPISDAGKSVEDGKKAPPKPPKVPLDDGPLVPDKSTVSSPGGKQSGSGGQSQYTVPRKPTFAERAGNGVQFAEPNGQISTPGQTGTRNFSGGVTTTPPTRKPTGPRSMSGTGSSPAGVQRTRFRGSPSELPEWDSADDETF